MCAEIRRGQEWQERQTESDKDTERTKISKPIYSKYFFQKAAILFNKDPSCNLKTHDFVNKKANFNWQILGQRKVDHNIPLCSYFPVPRLHFSSVSVIAVSSLIQRTRSYQSEMLLSYIMYIMSLVECTSTESQCLPPPAIQLSPAPAKF